MDKILLIILVAHISCGKLQSIEDKGAILRCHQTGACPNEINGIRTNNKDTRSVISNQILSAEADDIEEAPAYHYKAEAWRPMPINGKHSILYGSRFSSRN